MGFLRSSAAAAAAATRAITLLHVRRLRVRLLVCRPSSHKRGQPDLLVSPASDPPSHERLYAALSHPLPRHSCRLPPACLCGASQVFPPSPVSMPALLQTASMPGHRKQLSIRECLTQVGVAVKDMGRTVANPPKPQSDVASLLTLHYQVKIKLSLKSVEYRKIGVCEEGLFPR